MRHHPSPSRGVGFAVAVSWLSCVIAAGCEARIPTATPVRSETSKETAAKAGEPNPPPEPETPVELKILNFEGIERLVAGHRGQVVVMDAWSTSCLPCVREFPHLVELQSRFGRADVACVSLSFDYEGLGKPEDEAPRVLKFLQSKQAAIDNILSSDASDKLYRELHLTSIPAVFVYDRKGELRKRFDNEAARTEAEMFNYDQVSSLVAELVKEQP